jgi:hypothetical protein
MKSCFRLSISYVNYIVLMLFCLGAKSSSVALKEEHRLKVMRPRC